MSVLVGTVRQAESKPSQYGDGMYNRIQLEGDNGHTSWYTSYADANPQVGDYITAEIGESKKSGKEYIRSWKHHQEQRGDMPPKAQTPATGAPGGSQGGSNEERQLSIVTQSLFKTIYPVANGELQAKDCILHCIKLAQFMEKEVRAAVASKHIAAAKAELELVEQQNHETQQSSEEAGGFIDDDVPFTQLRGDLYGY